MERHLERTIQADDVWFAPMKEIAAHAKSNSDSLRREGIASC